MNNLIKDEADHAIATFVFAHGAGANKDHWFMRDMTEKLRRLQINVIRFDFPYMAKRALDGKKYPPNKMPILVEAFEQVIAEYKSDLPLFIGGKSMGSRVAMTYLSEQGKKRETLQKNSPEIKGAICLGYPFHPPKKLDKLRLEPLLANDIQALICQGDRDTLGNKEEVLAYNLAHNYHINFLPDGDHDFKPRVKSGFTHQKNLTAVSQLIQTFILAQLELL